jgi:hypothetical protein
VSTGLTALQQITVRGGPEGVAYVAGTTGAGATTFTVTTDQGATFATPTVLASGGATTYLAPGLAARGDDVFVQSQNSFATVYRNASRGSGSFSATALPTNTSGVFWGLMVDSAGNVWSGLDNSSLNLSKSTDGGVTFSSWTPVAGAGVMYSSWDLGGDVIWVAGYPGNGPYKISVSAPTVGTAVGGALIVNPNETTVAVDAAGTGYVAFGDATNGVRLQRATLADTSFGSATTIDAAGRNPALAAPAGTDKVVVAYDKAGEIWTTVKTF